jgi:hypothetical protein
LVAEVISFYPVGDMSSVLPYLPPEVLSIIIGSSETARLCLSQLSKQLRSKVDGSPIRLYHFFTECIEMRSLHLLKCGLPLVPLQEGWLSEMVCKSGWSEAVQLLIANKFALSDNSLSAAIDGKNTQVIRLLLAAKLEPTLGDICKCARKGCLQTIRILVGAASENVTGTACAWAAAAGRDDALWLLLSMGCPAGKALEEAIAAGSVECVKELNRNDLIPSSSLHQLREYAAKYSLACFRYFTTGVYQIALPPNTAYMYDAISNSNIECVQYLHATIGAPLDASLLEYAIENRQKKALRWLLARGVQPNEDTMWIAAETGFQYIDILVGAGAQFTTEHLEHALTFCVPIHHILRKLVGLGTGLTPEMLNCCLDDDDVHTFRLLLELGCPLPNMATLISEAVEKEACRIYFDAIELAPTYRVSWIQLNMLMGNDSFDLIAFREKIIAIIPRLYPPIRYNESPEGRIEWSMGSETMAFIISELGWDRFKCFIDCLQS